MSHENDYPSEHTGLQQTFFKKVTQSGENYRSRKNKAQSDFDDQKRRSVRDLDSRLRGNVDLFLSEPANSISDITNKLKIEVGQIVNGLRGKITNNYRKTIADNEAYKQSIQSTNSKEDRLVSKWGALNINRLNVSFSNFQSQDVPSTLEECARQIQKSRQKIAELGAPSQYGSGQLRRSTIEVIGDVLKGIFYPFKFYFLSLVLPFAVFLGAGWETGCVVAIIAAAILPGIFAGISWGISNAIGASFEDVLFILIGVVFGSSALLGGLGIYSSKEELTSKNKEKAEKRARLLEGYSAYLVLRRSQNLVQELYERQLKQLENEKNAGYDDAKKQEDSLFSSIDRFGLELEKTERVFQNTTQKIDADFQQEQIELKKEFEKILARLAGYSKLAISGWDDVFWQGDFSQALWLNQQNVWKGIKEIRIGKTVYPGNNPQLPMLIDLLRCGHIFFFETNETEWQATQLLKAITARLVFSIPIGGAKFTFMDADAAGVFAEYQQLPFKIAKAAISLPDEIQAQTQWLEQHQKQMQAKIGSGDLQTFNLTAKEPETRQVVCISGFPNPERFRTEAQSHLENIIRSGARVGIHVILKIRMASTESASRPIDQTLFFKNGIVLRPSKLTGQWEVCFNGRSFSFIPDHAPYEAIARNLIQQINASYQPKPVDKPMRVFLCYAFEDKALVREVYEKLKEENWLAPWLSEEGLLPGQEWEVEIEKNMENADAVILFLSNTSVREPGYVHKEIRKILDVADEKPEGTIFVIPFRLDECELPNHRLKKLHWLDYFPSEQREEKYKLLYKALRTSFDKNRNSR